MSGVAGSACWVRRRLGGSVRRPVGPGRGWDGMWVGPKIPVDAAKPVFFSPSSSAGVAQLVEHHLAKVDVESSSLFARSILTEVPVAQKVTGIFVSKIPHLF